MTKTNAQKLLLLETNQYLMIKLEYHPEEVGRWTSAAKLTAPTSLNPLPVVGEFRNCQSRTAVVRCITSVESVRLPSSKELEAYTANRIASQKNINPAEASG